MSLTTSARKLDVLIADDESVACQVMEAYLEISGCDVEVVNDGDEVLRLLRERGEPFDVLVLDVWMPGPPPRELLSRVRRMSPGSAVLFVSARNPGDLGSQPDDGPFHFLSKPFNRCDLQQAVFSAYQERQWRGTAEGPAEWSGGRLTSN